MLFEQKFYFDRIQTAVGEFSDIIFSDNHRTTFNITFKGLFSKINAPLFQKSDKEKWSQKLIASALRFQSNFRNKPMGLD
jgi:hypothetical protein